MKKQLFFVVLLFCSLFSLAQKNNQENNSPTKLLSIDSLMNPNMFPERVHSLQFIPKSDIVIYVKQNTLWQADAKGKQDSLLTLEQLNNLFSKTENRKDLYAFPAVKFQDANNFTFTNSNTFYQVNVKNKQTKVLAAFPSDARNIQIDYQNINLAYTRNNNLYLCANNKETVIASDANENILFGHNVHQNEFGIDKGIFWSPKANSIAFYRMDQTMVSDYPLVNTATRVATENPIKYPMAGMKSHHVTLGVYNLGTGKTIYLQTRKDTSLAEKENYLTNITWSPDEKYIYIQKLNRKQNHMWMECYNAETGILYKTLFEETNNRYVEPLNPLYFIPQKNNEFLYVSERDGYFHIYLCDKEGNLKKQLTKGNWIVKNIAGFDEKGTQCFFYATKDSPLETNFYSVEIATGKIMRITPQAGTHSVVANEKGTRFIDSYNSVDTPFKVNALGKEGKVIYSIFNSSNPLAQHRLPQTEIFTIKSADGNTDLYCRMIKPLNFNPNKKYPAIIYVYGGPHAQMITNSWLNGSGLFLNYLAQEGYVVFTVDSRGSANRGFEFESIIHRNLGDAECADQMEGVRFLKAQAFIDTARIGVDGWSYGGFMTISLKLRYPGVFKVATAGGPVIDWKWYEIMYGERYADNPEDNKDGYKKASLLNYVDNLEGKLMVIHGAQDPVVVWQHSLEFINQCIRKKKQVDYFVYPYHEHNVRGFDRVHLFHKLFNYYKENL